MNEFHIRGKLGMQVFELYAALPGYLGRPFRVIVNDGDGDDLSYKNRLPELFDYTVGVINRNGFNKQKAWTPSAIHKMFEARGRGNALFKLKKNTTRVKMDTILHMRGKDKIVAPVDSYLSTAKRLAMQHKLWILSDDLKFSGAIAFALDLQKELDDEKMAIITDYEVSTQNDIDDWYSCLDANEIYGCMSTFTLSTLLINPEKKIHLFGKKYNTGPYVLVKENYDAVEALMEYCPNVHWID